MKKLAIVITHPIQYYVPVFRLLAQQCLLKVFYTWGAAGVEAKHDPGFGKTVEWDLPLLEGYDYELLENVAKEPGSHHGKGIVNPTIIAELKEFAPDAILVYGYIYQSHLQVMRHFKGKVPLWFRGDSTLLDEKPGLKALLKQVYLKWVYSYVDKAFYVGTQNKAYFKKYGLKESQLVFAPHAIDNQRFAKDRKAESNKLREKLGVAENEVLILFAGKLEPKKNPELLLQAFLQLSTEKRITDNGQQSNNYHLLFVGNGLLEAKLKQIAKNEIRTTKNIHFMDFQNQTQMPVVYQACDIFCLPSQGPGETWGLAINEAMAAGKAILASNKVGCAVDLVLDDQNGFIFKSNDAYDLKEKLSVLLKHPNLIDEFGKQSEQLIQNWSLEQQIIQFIRTLNATN